MGKGRGFFQTIRNCNRDNIKSAFVWFGFTAGLGFLPFWIGLMAVRIFSDHVDWMDFLRHGEFVMYSAALLAPCLRLITRDTDRGNFVQRQFFTLLAVIGLVVAIVVYSFVKAAAQLHGTLNEAILASISISMLLASFPFAFVIFLLDNERSNPAVDTISRREVQSIIDDLKPGPGAA